MIPTVRGPIEADQLGRTLMHEHIFVLDHELHTVFPTTAPREGELIDRAVERLRSLKAMGIDTIVDLTVMGLGRSIDLVRQVAHEIEINVVVATGAYFLRDLPLSLQLRGPGAMFGGPEPLTELFLTEIIEGIEETGIRPGIIKCATDRHGVTKGVDRVLRAAARASVATGVPISTHTSAMHRVGLDQQRIFAEEGVDLGRVVIGHSGDTDDIHYLEELLANGSYLGMDRFGLDYFLPFDRRVDVVAELCRRGHSGRLVLSHDAACHNVCVEEQGMRAIAPRHGFEHISRDVLPALRERGVDDSQIEQMLAGNPKRILDSSN